jgi:uncharacterized protein
LEINNWIFDINPMITSLFQKIAINLIAAYQHTLSPDHGLFRGRFPYGFCRFYPSCSEYMKQAIIFHGFWLGLWFGIKRIIRCNPFTAPAVDPVPLSKF